MKKLRELTRRERVLIGALVAVCVVVGFPLFGYLYVDTYLPWARTREADQLLSEFSSSRSEKAARRLAEIADGDLVTGRKWVEILETILAPTVVKPKPFRTDERIVIGFRRPSLEFERFRVFETVRSSLGGRCGASRETRLERTISGGGRVDMTGLVSRSYGPDPPTVPGHYSAALEGYYRFYNACDDRSTDRLLVRLGLKEPFSYSIRCSVVDVVVPVEFDVLAPAGSDAVGLTEKGATGE